MNEYMKKTNHSQASICQTIGEHPSTFSNWMNGRHRPSNNAIIAMARIFCQTIPEQERFVFQTIHALSMDDEEKERR